MRGLLRSLLLVAFLPLPVLAQREQKAPPQKEKKEELEGFWPSDKIIELALTRWADEAAADNELDEDQAEQLRDRMMNRWPKFLKENRQKIQPVLNEFIEMRLEMEPPSKERVQDWADRAVPVFDSFREQINHGIEDFRDTLNPLQKAKFEANVLEFSAGMQVAEAKLKQWKRGEFEEREFWDPPRAERRRRDQERQAAQAAAAAANGGQPPAPAAPAPKDQIADEVGRWDKYVEQVIRTYQLDDAQRTTAQSCLKELKDRALAYRDRNKDQIAKLEGKVAVMQARNTEAQKKGAKSTKPDPQAEAASSELAEVKQQLTAVYGPIDDMFQELKRRVDSIPTREQRERVEKGMSEEKGGSQDDSGEDEQPAKPEKPKGGSKQ